MVGVELAVVEDAVRPRSRFQTATRGPTPTSTQSRSFGLTTTNQCASSGLLWLIANAQDSDMDDDEWEEVSDHDEVIDQEGLMQMIREVRPPSPLLLH